MVENMFSTTWNLNSNNKTTWEKIIFQWEIRIIKTFTNPNLAINILNIKYIKNNYPLEQATLKVKMWFLVMIIVSLKPTIKQITIAN